MPDTTPTTELRAAAALLREAASHATPGPWRTHDTWIDHGGHTATVLTDRPDINDTELVAWLPTMSNQPWDEARNAWRNAGWMALMDPSVGLALADWLDASALLLPVMPPSFNHDHALRVARLVLGTTDQQPETAPTDRRARYAAAIRDTDGWVLDDGQHMVDAVMAVADAEQQELRAQIANLRTMYDVADARTSDLIEERDQLLEARVDRAAVLREAADALDVLEAEAWEGADSDEFIGRATGVGNAKTAVRRLADEAQQPETEAADTCRPVVVDGDTVLVRGGSGFTEEDAGYFAEVVRAARRRYAAEHPDQPDTETEAAK